jgi:pSer/pThr/pTyr-binding forkhead associated (FHA) protein
MVSSNGVFVNGRRLPRGIVAELNTGDLILLCIKKIYGFVVENFFFFDESGRAHFIILLKN